MNSTFRWKFGPLGAALLLLGLLPPFVAAKECNSSGDADRVLADAVGTRVTATEPNGNGEESTSCG